MVEIPQWLINTLLTLASSVFGWFLRVLYDAQNRIEATVKELEINLAQNYMPRADIEGKIDRIFEKLDRIEDKLDRKADRSECPIKEH